MEKVTKEKQITVITPNEAGTLAEVTGVVADNKVTLRMSAPIRPRRGRLSPSDSDNEKAKNALEKKRIQGGGDGGNCRARLESSRVFVRGGREIPAARYRP